MNATSKTEPEASPGVSAQYDLHTQLVAESQAMMRYAAASGLSVPSEVAKLISGALDISEPLETNGSPKRTDTKELIDIHNRLGALVAPATPRTILYAGRATPGFFGAFGAIPLLRQLGLIAWIAIIVLVGTVTTEYVGSGTPGSMAAINAHGLTVILNQFFFMAAATIGACFFALFQARDYIAKTTFDPVYIPVYWTRLGLGILAGVILANFLAIDSMIGLIPDHLERVTVALLGGFSADAVFAILTRLVETLKSLVQGDASGLIDAEKQRFQSRLNQEHDRNRLNRANELISLRKKLTAGGDAKELEDIVNQLIEKNLNG